MYQITFKKSLNKKGASYNLANTFLYKSVHWQQGEAINNSHFNTLSQEGGNKKKIKEQRKGGLKVQVIQDRNGPRKGRYGVVNLPS